MRLISNISAMHCNKTWTTAAEAEKAAESSRKFRSERNFLEKPGKARKIVEVCLHNTVIEVRRGS